MTWLLTMLAGSGGKIAGWIMAAGSALLALLAVRKSGEQAQQNKDLKQTIANTEKRSDADAQIGSLSDTDVDRELRDKWSRR